LTAAVLLFAGGAEATSVLRLSVDNGVTWIANVADQGPGDSNPTVGVITYVDGAGPFWTINVTTGVSKPVFGSAVLPVLDLNSVNISLPGLGQTLLIQFSDSDFGPLAGGLMFQSSIGGTLNSAFGSPANPKGEGGILQLLNNTPFIALSTWGDSGNDLFGNDGMTAQSTLGPFPAGAFSATSLAPEGGPLAAPYSLTIQAVIHPMDNGGSASFDARLETADAPIPEPITVAGVLMGVAGLAGYVRRRWIA